MTLLRCYIFIDVHVYVQTCKNFTHNYREYVTVCIHVDTTLRFEISMRRVVQYIPTLHFQLMEVVDWNEVEARSGGLKHS